MSRSWMVTREKTCFASVMRDSTDASSGKLSWTLMFDEIARKRRGFLHYSQDEMEKMAGMLLDAALTGCCDDEAVLERFSRFYSQHLFYKWMRIDSLERGSRWIRRDPSLFQSSWSVIRPLIEPEPRPTTSSSIWQLVEFMALNIGDWRYVSAMARYGSWSGIADRWMAWPYSDFKEFFVYAYHQTGQVQEMFNYYSEDRMRPIFRKLQDDDGTMVRRDVRRGIPLIVRSLKAAILKSEGHPSAKEYVRTLQMYFVIVVHPLVSEDEVRELLLYVLSSEDHRPFVDRLVGTWVELFGRQAFEPRRLKHLCRHTLRDVLLKNKSGLLPSHVESLRIPRSLKSFLLGS